MMRLLAGFASLFLLASPANTEDPPERIQGTVLSVRGNILHVRPSLRPKLARILVNPKTEIVGNRRTDRNFLKPGMRVRCGGMVNESGGINVFFVAAARTPIGDLKATFRGIEKQNGGWAIAGGTLKSIEPFVFTDDDGKEIRANLDRARFFLDVFPMEKAGLLIGTRLMATGKFAPDGVLQADIISPQQDQSAAGSMYGEIVRVEGRRIQVRPRYTQDTITVVRKADCILQKEVRLDPDGFKVGDPVTFWGHYVRRPGSERPLLGALALLVGNGRYPTSSDPESAGVFLSGRLSSLEPVVLLSPSGQKTEIIVPAQIAIARLDRVSEAELTVGTPVMMVLSSGKDDTFEASHIIVDASPWVGYGG